MKRNLFLGLLVLFGLVACEDRETSLLISRISEIDQNCDPDGTKVRYSGVVDMIFTNEYIIYPHVVNRMRDIQVIKSFSAEDARRDTHDVLLHQAVIDYEPMSTLEANIR